MKHFFNTTVITNTDIAEGYKKLTFNWNAPTSPVAGQFITIKDLYRSTPLLRRPFALSAYDKGMAEIIYQVRGEGTRHMACMESGSSLSVLGPLGNTFPVSGKPAVLIGGGIGIGPMLYLAENLNQKGIAHRVILGFRNASLVPENAILSKQAVICTDDGSEGFNGSVLDYLKTDETTNKDEVFYLCGPYNMMKAIQSYTHEKNNKCFVSMEEMMACGVGVCMGCVVEMIDGSTKRVCHDGPVFNAQELVWI